LAINADQEYIYCKQFKYAILTIPILIHRTIDLFGRDAFNIYFYVHNYRMLSIFVLLS